MPYSPKRPPRDPCPVEEVLEIIGGKWKARILLRISLGPCGFAELRRALAGVSQQVLSTQLQALMDSGVVRRAVVDRASESVRYAMTPKGESLLPVLDVIASWGDDRLRERGLIWERPRAVAG